MEIQSSIQQASTSFSIVRASSASDLAAVADLFSAYTAWLGENLQFQGYAAELAGLPGKYSPPQGALLLARDAATGGALGCIALRPLVVEPRYESPELRGVRCCEIKRLYTEPAARGRGVARGLMRAALDAAVEAGYGCILLDSLARMDAAIQLYRKEEFVEVEPYYDNPLGDVVYMAKKI